MKLVKLLFFILLTVVSYRGVAQQDLDAQRYSIHLTIRDFSQEYIEGFTDVTLAATTNNVQTIQLELLDLNVDSVLVDGQQTTNYTQANSLVLITPDQPLSTTDTVTVRVHYSGTPAKDPNEFGGFLFSSNYAFNLGVSLNLIPHNFGKAWFPCIDNFTDKARYEFFIETDSNHTAVCNGEMLGVSTLPQPDSTRVWHWELNEPIPTYLASVAVGPYVAYHDTLSGLNGDIPMVVYARQNQLSSLPTVFSHMQATLTAYETRFGPYIWNKIGFVGTSFSGGAMEHATNVALPDLLFNSVVGPQFDWVISHELSHSWFGNNITCATAEDMWLNEGFARYCEVLYYEDVEGVEQGRDYFREIQTSVIRAAHANDGGIFHPLSPMPQAYTYGTTIYDKGAAVVHTLRHYIGDAAFNTALSDYFQDSTFSTHTSPEFRDYLSSATGQNLNAFFDGWVFEPGLPHFSVDSMRVLGPNGSQFDVAVGIDQKLYQRNNLVLENRIPLRFIGQDFQTFDVVAEISPEGSDTFAVPFEPVDVLIDPDERVADATLDRTLTLDGSINYNFQDDLFLRVNTSSIADSAQLQFIHNWAAPGGSIAEPGINLNAPRYWSIRGRADASWQGTLSFVYNNDPELNNDPAGPDSTWITSTEDSLVLLHRADASQPWSVVQGFEIFDEGSVTDFTGSVRIDTLVPGDYALGVYDVTSFAEEDFSPRQPESFTLYPNPAQQAFYLSGPEAAQVTGIEVLDLRGATIQTLEASEFELLEEQTLRVQFELPTGTYLVRPFGKSGYYQTQKVLIRK